MLLDEKIAILSGAARYDVSCSSSGSSRGAGCAGMGATSRAGICHSWADDGRCISLLKILLSNYCIYDCAYCINRRGNDVPRASFTTDEIVNLTIDFYRRNYIEGLFLSSAVQVSPDNTTERMINVARRLRNDEQFGGYIHLKIIPGTSPELIQRAGFYADRLSVNIELPSEKSLKTLAPDKNKQAILQPMRRIGREISENRALRRKQKRLPRFAPAGQSTQLIIGASPENDLHILRLASGLYERYALKRVYYSAYMPAVHDRLLPELSAPPLLREHRLYQADWLLRYYGFQADEILSEDMPDLAEAIDPKQAWAYRHPGFFPVDVNRADRETLLRVPGLGLTSVARIIASRRFGPLDLKQLDRIGVVLKRARPFIICRDYQPPKEPAVPVFAGQHKTPQAAPPQQLDFFDEPDMAIQRRS